MKKFLFIFSSVLAFASIFYCTKPPVSSKEHGGIVEQSKNTGSMDPFFAAPIGNVPVGFDSLITDWPVGGSASVPGCNPDWTVDLEEIDKEAGELRLEEGLNDHDIFKKRVEEALQFDVNFKQFNVYMVEGDTARWYRIKNDMAKVERLKKTIALFRESSHELHNNPVVRLKNEIFRKHLNESFVAARELLQTLLEEHDKLHKIKSVAK